MKRYRYCLLGALLSINSFAGKIKTITVGPYKMGTVYLSTGRSTVLTFERPPKKIIVGNSNYFNIEFTGIDVTIQPLSNIESNIFIYTDKLRYGVILKPGNPKKYDDLVYLKWKAPKKVKKKKPREYLSSQRKNLRLVLTNTNFNSRTGVHLIDYSIQNLSMKKLNLKSSKIWITRNNKLLPILEKVLTKESLTAGESTRIRLIVRLKLKKGFTTHLRSRKTKVKLIVPRRML